MSRVYGDVVDVWTIEGRPTRFVWQGQCHTVRRVLEHWVTSRDWWRARDERPAEHDAPAEQEAREFWRVEATPETAGTDVGVYELRHDQADQAWLLSRAWDR
jgi:Domain of unknown function (DUF6504)